MFLHDLCMSNKHFIKIIFNFFLPAGCLDKTIRFRV